MLFLAGDDLILGLCGEVFNLGPFLDVFVQTQISPQITVILLLVEIKAI